MGMLHSDLCTVKAILRMGARENGARDSPSPLACPIVRAVLSCAHITCKRLLRRRGQVSKS